MFTKKNGAEPFLTRSTIGFSSFELLICYSICLIMRLVVIFIYSVLNCLIICAGHCTESFVNNELRIQIQAKKQTVKFKEHDQEDLGRT